MTNLKSECSFLSSIQPEEIKKLIKVGNALYPFLGIASNVVDKHPEILPPVFDKIELKKDYDLYMALKPILLQLNELHETLNRTSIALSSDVLTSGLQVYSYVKQNKDKVPGLNATYEEMKVFFSKSKRQDAASEN